MKMQNAPGCLIDCFDQVAIINMLRRADRRRETQAEFRRHGFPLGNGRVEFFEALCPGEAAGFPSPGVRGCFLSHQAVLTAAHTGGSGSALVLEDDIAFSREVSGEGLRAVRELQQLDWDIAYLGHALESRPGPAAWLPVAAPMLLAHCYAVHQRVLPRLIAFLQQVQQRPAGHPDGGPMHYDGALNTFLQQNRDVRAYYCSVNLGYQRPSRTDLHRPSIIDRNPFLRPFAGLYRQLKRNYLRIHL